MKQESQKKMPTEEDIEMKEPKQDVQMKEQAEEESSDTGSTDTAIMKE